MTRALLLLFFALDLLTMQAVAQTAAFERDARERARIEARRYEILRAHLDVPALPPAAQAEVAALNESLRIIDQPYRDTGPTAAGTGMYQLMSRTRELVAAETGPAWNRLMLERFPLPEQIKRDYPDDARYAAALIVIGYEFAFARTLRPPRLPELEGRDALYSQATEAVLAPYRAKGEQSREWRVFERDMLASSQSAAFKREVLGRYIPLFAGFVRDDPVPESDPSRPTPSAAAEWLYTPVYGDEFDDHIIFRGHVVTGALIILLLMGGLVIPWWVVPRRGRRHNAPRQRQPADSPLSLPPDLQAPALPGGLRPDLFVKNARVLDLQTWSETTVSWQSTSGNQYVAPQVSVQTSTVQKDRLWVQTSEGTEEAWMLSGGNFAANRGHFLSWVHARLKDGSGARCLIFNHNTQQWYEGDWLKWYHGGFWLHWILLNVLWLVPGCVALHWVFQEMRGPVDMVPTLLGTLAVASFAWIGLLHWWTLSRRRRAWQNRYRPRVLDWLRGLSAPMKSAEQQPPFTQAG
jgi:hypothetical protein